MGAQWLGSLPMVLRNAGLEVDVYPGWETRSRSTGGYDEVRAIQCHHTASDTTPVNDMAYMWRNAADKPIGALYLDRRGRWTVGAAGATNTSGRGGPLATSRGTIPLNSANRYVISIEAANRGNGEPWPDVQLESYIAGVAALAKAYLGTGVGEPGDIHAHHEWTTRKTDPAGQSWYANGRNKWNMSRFRDDVENNVAQVIYAGIDSNGTDYNKHAWVVPGGGGGLVLQEDWTVRTASLRNGQVTVGAHNSYSRPMTAKTYTVPFEVSVELFLHSRLDAVTIFGENRTPTWMWAVNVHPVFVNEDNNVVTGFAPNGKYRWSASGQVNGAYGIAREELFVASIDHDAQFGSWHKVRMVVPAEGVHEVWWDDRLAYRVIERYPPAAWWGRPMRAGLRLDFYDYSLRIPSPSTTQEIDMVILDYKPGTPQWTRLVSTGTHLAHVQGHYSAVLNRSKATVVVVNDAELDSTIASSSTTTDPPSEFSAARKLAWQERRAK